MAKVLVSGTLAIDYLGRYPGRFSNLPNDMQLNFTVQLDAMERAFGGCALNICYSLKLLGDEPLPLVATGREFEPDYRAHLDGLGIDTRGIRVIADQSSAHAFVITDAQGNQFTAFYPGPTDQDDTLAQLEALLDASVALVVLAPDVAPKMIRQARWLAERGVPFLTDPGQGLNDFTREEMDALIDASHWLVVNRFEWRMLTQRLGLSAAELHARLDWTVITQGSDGAVWRAADGEQRIGHARDGEERVGEELRVAAVAPVRALDPTGCGDAFRAGLVHGLARQAPMLEALRCAVTTATLNLECHGTQTHRVDSLVDRYTRAWGAPPDWLVAAARQHQGAKPT